MVNGFPFVSKDSVIYTKLAARCKDYNREDVGYTVAIRFGVQDTVYKVTHGIILFFYTTLQ